MRARYRVVEFGVLYVSSTHAILLLGPVRVEIDGVDAEIPPKARLMATRLAMAAPRVVPVDVLIEELWAGNPPATARKSLQKYVWELRSHLGDEAIVTEGPRVSPGRGDRCRASSTCWSPRPGPR